MIKNNIYQLFKLSFVFLPASLFLTSCNSDFESVETFVNQYQSGIQSSSDALAQDIYDSCLRTANYNILIVQDGIEQREETIQKCNSTNQPNIEEVKKANKVLLDYMTSLGKVASRKTASPNKSINELKTSLTNLKIGDSRLPDTAVKAGTNILTILVNTLYKSERGKALKKAIICSDDSLQTYIKGNSAVTGSSTSGEQAQRSSGGLIQIVQDGYLSNETGILGLEKQRINGYYQTYFAVFRKANNSQTNDAQLVASHIYDELEIQKDYINAMNIIQTKTDNAQSYIKLLENTAKAHNQLKEEFQGKGKDAISTEQVNELCKSVLANKVSQLEKSDERKKLELTEQQLRNAMKT